MTVVGAPLFGDRKAALPSAGAKQEQTVRSCIVEKGKGQAIAFEMDSSPETRQWARHSTDHNYAGFLSITKPKLYKFPTLSQSLVNIRFYNL